MEKTPRNMKMMVAPITVGSFQTVPKTLAKLVCIFAAKYCKNTLHKNIHSELFKVSLEFCLHKKGLPFNIKFICKNCFLHL